MMTIGEIIKLRSQLPDNWVWSKCYELCYVNTRTGRQFIQKHWALTAVDGKGPVFSLGLISHNSYSPKKEFFKNDIPVLWVEKSLEIVDCLFEEINRLKLMSMQLKIINPSSVSFHGSVGISDERANQLSDALDDLVKRYSNPPKVVSMCDVFNDIASFCNGLEEYTYCIVNHVSWHAANGRILCMPKSSKS